MMHATWSYPTAIRSGSGRVAETGEACRNAGITNPMIVTDPGLVDLPPIAAVRAALADADLVVGSLEGVRLETVAALIDDR